MKDETLKIELTINGVVKHGMITPTNDSPITIEDVIRLWAMLTK